jgi:hypothetical protein
VAADVAFAPTGLAVQRNGRLLAVAHGAKNLVRLYDKTSGAALGTLELPMANSAGMPAPGASGPAARPLALNRIAFSARGDLWVVGAGSVWRYVVDAGKAPVLAATVAALAAPIAVATDPADEDTVWIADAGERQQLLRVDRQGATVSTVGEPGGYRSDPAASARKFCFSGVEGQAQTALVVTPDRALWFADTCNNRVLRRAADGSIDAPVAYLPAVYAATADTADPRRVFANFLEFEIDPANALEPGNAGWRLVRNWLPSIPADLADTQSHRNHGFGGFRSVLTLPGGRTIALVAAQGRQHLVELPVRGPMRRLLTLAAPVPGQTETVLYEDGSLGWAQTSAGVQRVLRRALLPGSEPRWADGPQTLAQVVLAEGLPTPRGAFTGILGPRFPVTDSGLVVFFDTAVQGNDGFHLGAVVRGGDGWSWLASPSGVLDGRGSFQTRKFDPRIEYGGNAVWAAGRHVLYGFHGEFYTDAGNGRVGQANQFMHFLDNGLFVGQFGVPSTRDAPEGAPGLSGNAFSPTLVRHGGALYLLHNDESAHGGIHRWRIDGHDAVQELRVALQRG